MSARMIPRINALLINVREVVSNMASVELLDSGFKYRVLKQSLNPFRAIYQHAR